MLDKIPYYQYCKIFIVASYVLKKLNEELQQLELPIITDNQYNQLKEEITTLCPRIFDNKKPTIENLIKLQLIEGYAYKINPSLTPVITGMEGAIKMLQEPLLRRTLQALAMAKITDEDIELITNGKYDIQYTSEDYKCFFNYFFNINDWSLKDKRDFISQPGLDSRTIQLYKIALDADKPKLLWKLGFSPGLTFEEMLRQMVNDSFYQFKEHSVNDPDTAVKWATITERLMTKLKEITKETETKTDMYSEMTIKLKKVDIDVDIKDATQMNIEIPDLKQLNNTLADLKEFVDKTNDNDKIKEDSND